MRQLALCLMVGLLGCGNSGSQMDAAGPQPDLGGSAQDLAGAKLIAVNGVVLAVGGTPMPVSGATVSVVGASPAVQTTSAMDGTFTLMLAAGSTVFLRASSATYVDSEVGWVVPTMAVVVPDGGMPSIVHITLIPTATLRGSGTMLNPGLTFDATKGIVVVGFNDMSKLGGYGATISASHGMSFITLNNTPQYSATTVAGGDSSVVFPNVAVGTTTVSVTMPSGKNCTADQAITNYLVDPNTFTTIGYQCM